jgi:hypothetical protein
MANKDVRSGREEKTTRSGYNEEIDKAKVARNNQFKDTDPRVEKEGFLGVDDLDRMRRRKIK